MVGEVVYIIIFGIFVCVKLDVFVFMVDFYWKYIVYCFVGRYIDYNNFFLFGIGVMFVLGDISFCYGGGSVYGNNGVMVI